jgi:transcriptional regulator with XRE-family HTH domain
MLSITKCSVPGVAGSDASIPFVEQLDTPGKRLRKWRITCGYTQKSFAEACGWEGTAGQSRISLYENDQRRPKLPDLDLMARRLGIDAQEILFDHPLNPTREEELLLRAYRVATPHERRMLITSALALLPDINKRRRSRPKK